MLPESASRTDADVLRQELADRGWTQSPGFLDGAAAEALHGMLVQSVDWRFVLNHKGRHHAGRVRVIASMEDPLVIEMILAHREKTAGGDRRSAVRVPHDAGGSSSSTSTRTAASAAGRLRPPLWTTCCPELSFGAE